jgi:hypothetical protein
MTFKYPFTSFLLTLLLLSCSSAPLAPKIVKSKLSKRAVNKCIKKMKYYKLLTSMANDKKYFHKIDATTLDSLCTKSYKSTNRFMNKHFNRIGIILEQHPGNEDKTQAIIEGIKESLRNVDHKVKGRFVIKKIALVKKKVNRVLSNMILKDKVGIIITWGQKKFIKHIQRWQKGLDIPTIFISNKTKTGKNSFNVFPNRKNYGLEFIRTLKRKNIKRIAILTPARHSKTPLLRTIKYYLKKYGITVVEDVQYIKDDYTSYDMACRKIFTINRFARRTEYNQILSSERKKARKEGFKLNKKLVFLPARVDYDAIFIPDDFKTVHYFTKLFKYYQAKNVQLIGTYQWRSDDLLTPKEKILEGATFIDFLGDYKNLPFKVSKTHTKDVSNSFKTDYKLMGYYTGLLGQMVLKKSNNNKSKIRSALRKAKINDNFIGKNKAFTNNKFNWPSFAIEIKSNKFKIISSKK